MYTKGKSVNRPFPDIPNLRARAASTCRAWDAYCLQLHRKPTRSTAGGPCSAHLRDRIFHRHQSASSRAEVGWPNASCLACGVGDFHRLRHLGNAFHSDACILAGHADGIQYRINSYIFDRGHRPHRRWLESFAAFHPARSSLVGRSNRRRRDRRDALHGHGGF